MMNLLCICNRLLLNFWIFFTSCVSYMDIKYYIALVYGKAILNESFFRVQKTKLKF